MGSPAIPYRLQLGRFTVEQVQAYCLVRQHLEDSSKGSDLVKVTDDICGLHATSTLTPYLSLFNRIKKFDVSMLDSELGEHGGLVRMRGVRGTLFIVPRSRVPLIRGALGTPKEPSQKWYSLRGMGRREFFELKSIILDSLKGRSLSIQEIKTAVPKSKIRTISFRASRSVVRSATNVTWAVNWLVATRAILSQKVGGLQDALKRKRPASDIESLPNRYTLAEDALGKTPSISRRKAQTGFVRWYLENYSPTTVEDIKWWTGLPGSIIRDIVSRSPDVVRIRVEGFPSPMMIPKRQAESFPSTEPRQPQISLLPYEDPFPKGYKLRRRFGSSKVADRAYRGGSVAPTVTVNGRIVATWKFSAGNESTVFQIHTLEPIEREVSKIVVDRAKTLADFLFPDKENSVLVSDKEKASSKAAA